ncbi:MAG: metal ABC transporter permease [Actinobacteria bacterium]|nr:metal ABC transporter permease [Actinomycetota bacterium]
MAVLWGFSPVVGAFISALVMSGLVTAVSARTTVREDTAIGLLFVGMLALGVVIVSRARSFTIEVTALLFGDVLGVTSDDIRTQVIAAAIVVIVSVIFYRPFLALTFNREKALTLGMRPGLSQAVLLSLLALSIVASFQAIGTLLVFGLLVGPPATAMLLVKRVPMIMVVAIASGAIAVTLGLAISFHYDTAGGATMAGLSVLQFFIVFIAQEVRASLRNRKLTPASA